MYVNIKTFASLSPVRCKNLYPIKENKYMTLISINKTLKKASKV